MSDDPSKPPHEPLQYYQPPENRTGQVMGRILGLLGGFVVAGVIMGVGGTALFAVVLGRAGKPGSTAGIVIGAVGAIGFAVLAVWHVRRGQSLSIEQRTRGMRFFVLGILIGCGILILLQGLCFSAIANV